MRGKDSKGNWRTPFSPHKYIGEMDKRDITEGTNWQYSWYVPHDVQGLINLMGGDSEFEKMFDQLFSYRNAEEVSEGSEDILGRIGEYWH
jgi:putative alpha-1,2-mannosidase